MLFSLTVKDGLLVKVGALGGALLAQLLGCGPAGDVGLDHEAVALAHVQPAQLDQAALGVVHLLQKTEKTSLVSCSCLGSLALATVRVCCPPLPLLTLPVDLFLR